MPGKYDDIIALPRHISPKRAPMPIYDRAAQFAPFAALTGHDAIIRETARLTDDARELTESRKQELNDRLTVIQDAIDSQPTVTITYFQPDEFKAGGAYRTVTERVRKLDTHRSVMYLSDFTAIPFCRITRIEGAVFERRTPHETDTDSA